MESLRLSGEETCCFFDTWRLEWGSNLRSLTFQASSFNHCTMATALHVCQYVIICRPNVKSIYPCVVFQDDLDSFSLIRDVGCPGNILQSHLGLTESECASSCLQTAGCMGFSWQENPPHVCDVKSVCTPFSVRASTDIYIRTEG